MKADRPNILVIQADQLAASAIGAYRNPIASTPHIDSLARDIFASQRRRLFLCEVLAKGKLQAWDYSPADELEQHCLRADKIYSQWAYEGILGYRFPEE